MERDALMQADLPEAVQLMSSIVDTIPAMVFVKRAEDLRFILFNRAGEELLGWRAADLLGKNDYDFFPKEQADFFTSEDRKVLALEHAWEVPEEEITTARGEKKILHTRKIAVRGADGQALYLLGVSLDITERKNSEEQIKNLAYFDPLTRLPNRRLLSDRLQQAMASSKRNGLPCALVLIDLDNFKSLNDSMGHELGDQLLVEAARRLTQCLREGDTVARLGGDEFIVLLKNLHEGTRALDDIKHVAEKILSVLREPYRLKPKHAYLDECSHTHFCSASMGVALFSGVELDEDELIKRADTAMYQAKHVGRDTWRFFDPAMQDAVMARAAIDSAMREAIEAQRFVLYFQAQVDLHKGVTGAEVLLRWNDPQHGLIPPARFIPAAEENGLIEPLGRWVLLEACRQLARWAEHPATADLSLAVNVSARQFRHENFVEEVAEALACSGAQAARLKLELTESLLLEDSDAVIAKMAALKQMGVTFSLDDFGTGYSSLAYLKRLPLAQLKIDQSFVRDILTDPNDAVIAQTVIALARSFGLEVIAEGVESQAQRDVLASAGCFAFQGWYYCRPMPVAEFEAWLAQFDAEI